MKSFLKNILFFAFVIIILSCSSDPGVNDTNGDTNNPLQNDEVSFIPSGQSFGNALSFGMAIADIDLDGDLDILLANYNGYSTLWLNDGSGSFSRSSQMFGSSSGGTHDVDIADLNGDSFPDLILANHNRASTIYFNNGEGTFTRGGQSLGGADDDPRTVQFADIDNDGDIDILLVNNMQNNIWLNDGSGHFTISGIGYGGSDCNMVEMADFNGDSFPDMYLSFRNSPSEIWFNDGSGNLSDSGNRLNGAGDFIHCCDIEGDGDIDIVCGTPELRVWLNNGSGAFTGSPSFGEWAATIRLIDADNDGDCDLVTTEFERGNKFWINENGSFTSLGVVFGNADVHSMECADFNNDGKTDLIFGLLPGDEGSPLYFNETD